MHHFTTHKDILTSLLGHLDSFSICELVTMFLWDTGAGNYNDSRPSDPQYLDWFHEHGLIPQLVSKLGSSEEVCCANIAALSVRFSQFLIGLSPFSARHRAGCRQHGCLKDLVRDHRQEPSVGVVQLADCGIAKCLRQRFISAHLGRSACNCFHDSPSVMYLVLSSSLALHSPRVDVTTASVASSLPRLIFLKQSASSSAQGLPVLCALIHRSVHSMEQDVRQCANHLSRQFFKRLIPVSSRLRICLDYYSCSQDLMKDMPLPLLLEAVKTNIVPLVELLSKAPATIIRTQFGELDPPLGAMRLRVIECLAPLFLSQNDEIRAALLRSSALSSILVRESSLQPKRYFSCALKDPSIFFRVVLCVHARRACSSHSRFTASCMAWSTRWCLLFSVKARSNCKIQCVFLSLTITADCIPVNSSVHVLY
jgi:hypothetical protein